MIRKRREGWIIPLTSDSSGRILLIKV